MVCVETSSEGYYIPVGGDRKIFAHIEGDGEQAIVLIHGWGLNHEMWRDYIPALKNRYKVVAIDLRGFGKSSQPLRGYNYKTWATDVGKVIKCLELDHVTLAGYSLGGAISMYYVSMGVEPAAERLALMAAAGPCMRRLMGRLDIQSSEFLETQIKILEQDMRRSKRGIPDRRMEVFQRLYGVPLVDNAVWSWFMGMLFSASLPALLNALREIYKWDLTAQLKQISIGEQTRIFHGVKDLLVPFKRAEEQQRCISGSILKPFKNGHLFFYFEQADLSKELVW